MAAQLNSSAECPAFSDSDMSADEGSSTATHRDRGLIHLLKQENRVLKMELDTCRLRCKSLQEENRALRQASVSIQAKAEQEEEFISNTLLKKIQSLKKEKETLAMNYEQEEEFLTNDLSRKLTQLRQEKIQLEQTLEQEQEYQVNKLMRRIDRLEADVLAKQTSLEQLRKEKVDLENTLEQEQELLVNRLWKRMDRLEAEKRMLQEKLEEPISEPPSPRQFTEAEDTVGGIASHITSLREEIRRLRQQLAKSEADYCEKMEAYAKEERQTKEENIRLQRKLLREMERREALSRQLSESESSLEMDDERYLFHCRHFNEMTSHTPGGGERAHRERTISSPVPLGSLSSSLPLGSSPPTHHHHIQRRNSPAAPSSSSLPRPSSGS
ncbi:coiled-coil domain-containing protein 6 isoform X3 [Nematostella vectensis]|uniref:coiled-coil domain-containing protein 6 isoform X3 n=1 Tax=Nematostella vectensis TaxID=45351 RepID=UPI001390583C|nr:coiled-coil domain-containing protein 6 isoform X3 [Nematostella vectensis]